MADRDPRVLAIDAGGTMTDTFIVDGAGSFVVGKAQTTPEDESIGFMAVGARRARAVGLEPRGGVPADRLRASTRARRCSTGCSRAPGATIGAIVTGGQEDYLRIERGIQTYLGFSYSDRLHIATHYHNEPIVPREQMKGVRGRIDVMGDEVLPLREEDVRDAAAELLDAGVEGICICLLFSYRNAEHEIRAAEIVAEVKAERGVDGEVPVYLASELYPLRRDLPRLNSTLIEAYAAEPSRGAMQKVRDETKEAGAGVRAPGDGLARRHDLDRGEGAGDDARLRPDRRRRRRPGAGRADGAAERPLHRHRRHLVRHRADHRRALRHHADARTSPASCSTCRSSRSTRSAPGTGSFVRVNPNSNRPELGPDSAGARIGVCWPEGGLETVSVTDLNVVLGRVNPDYFLGGDIKLDPERARAEVERQVAEPLGLEVADAAAGVIELFEQTLRNEAVGRILGKGYSPADYALLCYGGGGPLHVAGYTEGVAYRDVLVPAWAAGFSAYGCACADFEYRYDQTIDMPILPTADEMEKAGIGFMVTGAWQGLRGAGRGRVREVGDRARPDRLHPLGADAVLRPAQRHRDRLPAHGDGGGRARRRADRRLRGRLREGLRALGPLARARLPDHPGDRPRLGRGREAGAARARRGLGRSRRSPRPGPCAGATATPRPRSSGSRTSRPGTRSRARRSSSTRRRRSRSRRGAAARLDAHGIFHLTSSGGG